MTGTYYSDSRTFGHTGAQATLDHVHTAAIVGTAFCLYWISSFELAASDAAIRFGADSWYYSELAHGSIFTRVASSDELDRIVRFHPLTVALAAVWMEALSPLTHWIAPLQLLKAMFAAVGAAGVWAATWGFASVVPRPQARLYAIVYAVSFGVWFFASIEESKIVSASLATLYIASYLHLRRRRTARGALLLTGILLLACLNEMVAGFLVVIPLVDTLMTRRGSDWPRYRWIAAHALAGPVAFLIVEGLLYSLLPATHNLEGQSHLGMLLFYLSENYRNLEMAYSFVVNWVFFNLAAPTADAPYWTPPGFFEPALTNYLSSPATVALVAVTGVMAFAGASAWRRGAIGEDATAIIAALLAYVAVRGAFFFVFNPPEPLLFSTSCTLALLLVIAIAFAASELPGKRPTIAAFAGLLLVTNGAFIFGQ
jgi:hypothetical protein